MKPICSLKLAALLVFQVSEELMLCFFDVVSLNVVSLLVHDCSLL